MGYNRLFLFVNNCKVVFLFEFVLANTLVINIKFLGDG
jgi:hypothetical protein